MWKPTLKLLPIHTLFKHPHLFALPAYLSNHLLVELLNGWLLIREIELKIGLILTTKRIQLWHFDEEQQEFTKKKNHSLFSKCIMSNLKTNDYFKHWHPCTRKIILNLHEFDRFCWINDTSVEVEDTSNCLLAKKVILSLSEVILSTACKIQRQSALFLKCQECKKGIVEPMTCMWIYR